MHRKRKKQQIISDNPELVLCENGDFKIKRDLVEQYEIIDMHCHVFSGLSQLFPSFLQVQKHNENVSLMDMDANHIRKAVIQQINPPKRSCAEVMDNVVKGNDRLYTFGSIHPYADNIPAKIYDYMKMDIKGWKLNPHIWGVPIDCEESIALLKELSKTQLPIMSCSGLGLPQEVLNSNVPTKATKKEVMT